MYDYSFLENNKYAKWYMNICNSRSNSRKIKFLTEKHHVKPISINENNLTINLTHREHFVVHWLLTKAVKKKHKHKMLKAIAAMSMSNNGLRNYKLTPLEYSILRKKHIESLSVPCSESRKTAISKARKKTLKIKCSFCEKETDPGNFKKYHGENCKHNPNIDPKNAIRKRELAQKSVRKSLERGTFAGNNNIKNNDGPFECPHCGSIGKNWPNMKRNHFERCSKINK